MYVFMYACMYVCMYVCMYACIYACMYACMSLGGGCWDVGFGGLAGWAGCTGQGGLAAGWAGCLAGWLRGWLLAGQAASRHLFRFGAANTAKGKRRARFYPQNNRKKPQNARKYPQTPANSKKWFFWLVVSVGGAGGGFNLQKRDM